MKPLLAHALADRGHSTLALCGGGQIWWPCWALWRADQDFSQNVHLRSTTLPCLAPVVDARLVLVLVLVLVLPRPGAATTEYSTRPTLRGSRFAEGKHCTACSLTPTINKMHANGFGGCN